MNKRVLGFFMLIMVLPFSFQVSCAREAQRPEIRLPATPALSLRGQWGVVHSNYLRLRADPSKSAEVLAGLAKGSIVKILSLTEQKETVEGETDYWYRVSLEGLEGWVFGAFMDITDSRITAAEKAEELK